MKKVLLFVILSLALVASVSAQDVMKISDVRKGTAEASVTVQGTVTVIPGAYDTYGGGNFYVQDETAGIYVASDGKDLPELKEGDVVKLTGMYKIGNDRKRQIALASAKDLSVVTSGEKPMVAATITTGAAKDYAGSLIRTQGKLIATTWWWGDDYMVITDNADLKKDNLWVYLAGKANVNFGTGTSMNGEVVCITGIEEQLNVTADYFYASVSPRTEADIVAGECPKS